MKPIALLIMASALAAATPATPTTDEALLPHPATWDARSVEGGPYLRGAASDGPAGRKLNFMCNDRHELIAMALFEDGNAEAMAAQVRSVALVIDGASEPALDRDASIPFAMNNHLVTLMPIGHAFRRMLNAPAIGIVWTGEGGRRLAAFQLSMTEGRDAFAAFARACNSDLYR